MKIFFPFVLAMSLCVSASSSAFAAPASPESVEQLLAVTRTEELLDSSYASVDRVMRQSVLQARGNKPMTAEEQRRIDATLAKVMAMMKDEMSWARMKPQYVRLYVDTFDQDEVNGLLAFYATPAGQAMINKMPIVMQKSIVMMQTQMQTLMPKMMAIVQESIAEAPAPK